MLKAQIVGCNLTRADAEEPREREQSRNWSELTGLKLGLCGFFCVVVKEWGLSRCALEQLLYISPSSLIHNKGMITLYDLLLSIKSSICMYSGWFLYLRLVTSGLEE